MSETTTPAVMPASPIRQVRHFILHPDVAAAHADTPMTDETHAAVAAALVEAAKGGNAVTLVSANSSSMLLVHPDDHVDDVAVKVAQMHEIPYVPDGEWLDVHPDDDGSAVSDHPEKSASVKSKASAKDKSPPKDSIENG